MNENINIDVKVGDVILTGKFKNKKTVIKTIGKDEHGMPTINGRKACNFRIAKKEKAVKESVNPRSDKNYYEIAKKGNWLAYAIGDGDDRVTILSYKDKPLYKGYYEKGFEGWWFHNLPGTDRDIGLQGPNELINYFVDNEKTLVRKSNMKESALRKVIRKELLKESMQSTPFDIVFLKATLKKYLGPYGILDDKDYKNMYRYIIKTDPHMDPDKFLGIISRVGKESTIGTQKLSGTDAQIRNEIENYYGI